MEQYLSQEVNWKQTSGVIVFLWCCSNGVHGGLSEGCFWVVVSLGLIVQRGLLTCQALYMKVTHWLVNHWHRLFFGRCKRGNKSRCVPLNVIRLARWQLTWLLHEKEYMIRTYQIYTYLYIYILYLYISIINRYDIYIYIYIMSTCRFCHAPVAGGYLLPEQSLLWSSGRSFCDLTCPTFLSESNLTQDCPIFCGFFFVDFIVDFRVVKYCKDSLTYWGTEFVLVVT